MNETKIETHRSLGNFFLLSLYSLFYKQKLRRETKWKKSKFELELQTPDSQTDILELYESLQREIRGLQMQIKENPIAKPCAMSDPISPVITMIMSSTIISASVTGIFSLVKDFFEFRRQKNGKTANKSNDNESKEKKIKDNDNKIVIRKVSKDRSEQMIEITNFTDVDKSLLLELLSK